MLCIEESDILNGCVFVFFSVYNLSARGKVAVSGGGRRKIDFGRSEVLDFSAGENVASNAAGESVQYEGKLAEYDCEYETV